MQIIKGSVIFKLVYGIFVFYQSSFLKKILSAIAEIFKASILAKWFQTLAKRESSVEYSVFVRFVKFLFKKVDKLVLLFSKSVQKWSGGSILVRSVRGIASASREKPFALVFPVFGIGYFAGRAFWGRLMIRDIFLLALAFFVSAVWMVGREKIRTFWENSLLYKLYVLVLE